MSDSDKSINASKLSKDATWIILTVVGAAAAGVVPLIGFTWQQSVEVAKTSAALKNMERSIDQLSSTVSSFIHTDMAEVKHRLLVMEQKDILPRAASEIADLRTRVVQLEIQSSKKP